MRWLGIAALWLLAVPLVHMAYGLVAMQGFGFDAHAYWLAARTGGETIYSREPKSPDAFLYSPAFAQVVWPLAQAPWAVFVTVWTVGEALAFGWLLRPARWWIAVPALAAVTPELAVGNVVGFVAVAGVLGIARPGFWAFGYLTKVSPGMMGSVWFAGRGELRRAVAPVLAAAVVGALSWVVWPGAWTAWFELVVGGGSRWTTARLAVALALVFIGGWRGWWWAPAVALCVGTPVFGGLQPFAYLAMLPRLLRERLDDAAVPPALEGARLDDAAVPPAQQRR